MLAEGTFSLVNAEQDLRDKWYHGICQSSATKVSFFMDNMFFDSYIMAPYLRDIRPSASLFSLIKFRLGAHSLRVETDRWLRPKPPREQRVSLIDWISDTRPQGCTDLQSPVKCLDHR